MNRELEEELEEYPPDVEAYLKMEKFASNYDMTKGEIYKNSKGIVYEIIKDSPHGEVYVWVKNTLTNGKALRKVPKTVVIS